MLMSTFKRTRLVNAAVAVAVFLTSQGLVNAQYGSTLFDHIERTIAQNNTEWTLLNKWPNPNPQHRIIMYSWELDRKVTRDRKEIFAWMVEERSADEAARTFYQLVNSAVGQAFQQLQIGDKCYMTSLSSNGVSLLLRKANLVVRLMDGNHIPGHTVPRDMVIRFAQEIASVVPFASMHARGSLEDNEKE